MTTRADSIIDATSIALILATLTEVLPPIAAALSILWMVIRIMETCTARALLAKLRRRFFNRADCLSKLGDK